MNRRQSIKVRHRKYHYDHDSRTYDHGNVVLSHEHNAAELLVPLAEQFFIRSVLPYVSRVKDPIFKEQLKAFVGQESMHAKETQRFLADLESRGFPVRDFQAWYESFIKWGERHFGSKLCLAITAGVEHYTTVMGYWLLKNNYYDESFPESRRDMLRWHAAEELEHKAIAYDLLQFVDRRNYPVRIIGFLCGMVYIFVGYRRALHLLLKTEGLSRRELRTERRRARAIRFPFISLRIPRLFRYLIPGFHPNELNDDGLSEAALAQEDLLGGATSAAG